MNRYKSPELPAPESLAKVTADYKRANDERAAKLARGPVPAVSTARLSDEDEIVRAEIIAQVDFGERQLDRAANGDDYVRLAHFYRDLGQVVREFCTLLGARSRRDEKDARAAMHEAIASLDRYRGAGR